MLGHSPAATCPSLGFFTCKVGTALRGALSQGDRARPPGHPIRRRWAWGLVGSTVWGSAWRCQSRVVSEEKVEAGRREDRGEACVLGSQSSAPRWAPTLCPEAGAGVQWGKPWLGFTCSLENKGVTGGFEQDSDCSDTAQAVGAQGVQAQSRESGRGGEGGPGGGTAGTQRGLTLACWGHNSFWTWGGRAWRGVGGADGLADAQDVGAEEGRGQTTPNITEVGDTGWGGRSGGQSGPECEAPGSSRRYPASRGSGAWRLSRTRLGRRPRLACTRWAPQAPQPSSPSAPSPAAPRRDWREPALLPWWRGVGTGAHACLTGASRRQTLSASS